MPRVLPKKHRFTDDELVVAFDSFASDDLGGTGVVTRGTKLRGGHRIVRSHPDRFIAAGTPEHEWPMPELSLAEADPDPLISIPDAIPLEERVRARWDLIVDAGYGFGTHIARGMILNRNERLVRQNAHCFETIPRALTPADFEDAA